jgi:hypothetical protein
VSYERKIALWSGYVERSVLKQRRRVGKLRFRAGFRYHFVRFIRSDCRLNIFGEIFSVPPETQYEYVVATVDVKEQKLKLFLDTIQVEEFKYQLR